MAQRDEVGSALCRHAPGEFGRGDHCPLGRRALRAPRPASQDGTRAGPPPMRCVPWRAFSDISTMRARLCCQGLRNGHRLHEADHRQQQGRHQQLLPQAKVNDRHRQRGLAPRYVADHLYALVFQVEGEDGEGGEMPEIFGRRRSNSETS